MGTTAIITILLIIVTLIVSYQGLSKHSFLERYAFEVDKVLLQKDHKRLITSGFLHVSWWHLGLNLLTLYFFGSVLEPALGPWRFLLIYFGSMLGGNLFALLIHRQHGDYSAVGASGAVCGVTFACIAIFPGFYINLFFFPMAGMAIWSIVCIGNHLWYSQQTR
jgi:membrane associated rhomboid family serine protease